MASSSSSSSCCCPLSALKLIAVSVILASTIVLFLLFPPHLHSSAPQPPRLLLLLQSSQPPPPPLPPSSRCSSAEGLPPAHRCSFARSQCPAGLLNYAALHFCLLSGDLHRSLPLLSLLLLLQFCLLTSAAGAHFSPAVARLSARLRLSPSMAAVTLLALGNGAPDAFASAAALRGGQPRTGLAAILSAGTFVSAIVVGTVAIRAAPFSLDPAPFVRDLFFYLVAASALFYVYLSAEIYMWQAVGLVSFYLFFLALVFWMDLGVERSRGGGPGEVVEMGLVEHGMSNKPVSPLLPVSRDAVGDEDDAKSGWGAWEMLGKMTQVWEVPISTLLKLTIPATSPSEWSRYYIAANIALCPLILFYSFASYIPLDHQIVFLLPQTKLPMWSVILFISLTLAVVHFFLEKEPPETEQIGTTLVAFIMSVFWISTTAGELLNCLAAIGAIMDLPPAILGLTVLAWGNSMGDLVADVALARDGQAATAMAGCFAGPMFNMLVGFGTALVIETAKVYPGAYELTFHISIVVAFVFLLLSLMGSLLVVTWNRFRVPRFWGFCLVGLYTLFTAVSLLIARFAW